MIYHAHVQNLIPNAAYTGHSKQGAITKCIPVLFPFKNLYLFLKSKTREKKKKSTPND